MTWPYLENSLDINISMISIKPNNKRGCGFSHAETFLLSLDPWIDVAELISLSKPEAITFRIRVSQMNIPYLKITKV